MKLFLHFTEQQVQYNDKNRHGSLSRSIAFLFFWILQTFLMEVHAGNTKPFLVVPCYITQSGVVILRAKLLPFNDTLNFVLDTGSGGASLDSTLCQKLSLVTRATRDTVVGIAGKKTAVFVNNQSLDIQSFYITDLRFHINDYNFLSENLGVKVAGVLGKTLFQRFVLEIDYDKRQVKFYHFEGFKYSGKGSLLKMENLFLPAIDISLEEKAEVTGKYILDSGAEICLIINRAFLQDNSLIDLSKKSFPVEVEGLGGTREMQLTTIRELAIDHYTFKKVPVYVFDDQFQVTRYPIVKGIIGSGILRRFNMVLNYPANEIFLRRNNNFLEPFNYSYTGLSVYSVNGHVFVSSIVKNSPADNAGLMPDDQIIAVDDIESLNFEDMKEYIMSATRPLHMLVKRNGEEVKLKLRIKSILSD